MQYSFVRSKAVRQLVKEHGKRCGHLFLAALDRYLKDKIIRCLEIHNGNRKTMDDSLVNLTK
jgi:hypothetical protein